MSATSVIASPSNLVQDEDRPRAPVEPVEDAVERGARELGGVGIVRLEPVARSRTPLGLGSAARPGALAVVGGRSHAEAVHPRAHGRAAIDVGQALGRGHEDLLAHVADIRLGDAEGAKDPPGGGNVLIEDVPHTGHERAPPSTGRARGGRSESDGNVCGGGVPQRATA